jgi:acyl-CoA dehydrogenase
MIGFDLTEEQVALQDMAHKFAANEIRPRAEECDRSGTFPKEIFRKAFDLGLMTGFVPEAYGDGPG